MTQFAQPSPADEPQLRLVTAVPPSADRPYPHFSPGTGRILRALDHVFDGVDAIIAVPERITRLLGRSRPTGHRPLAGAPPRWHPSTGTPLPAEESPALRLVR